MPDSSPDTSTPNVSTPEERSSPASPSEGVSTPGAWIPIAHILRPQGRKGEVLADLLTDLDLDDQFRAGRTVSLAAPPPGHGRASSPLPNATVTIENHWLPTGKNAGRIVLKLAGYDSISAAELLARYEIRVPKADLPTLDPDTFYVNDLIGCTLFDNNLPIGTVTDIEFAMSPDGKTRLPEAAPLLAISLTSDSEPILIPFVRAHLDHVDLPTKRILMHLPPGLFDTPEE